MTLFFCVVLIGLLFSSGILPDIGMATTFFVGIAIVVLLVPAVLFDQVGIPTLHPSSGAFLALPNPTVLGFAASIFTSTVILYLAASTVSLLWYKLRSKSKLPDSKAR
ncbi:MAG: hypothetical protein Q8R39_02240 [bacterium]|nr:hypothetical protein [bacterium]MDZ4285056.1 hypothetical protein [Patescibacteria group bacterium]